MRGSRKTSPFRGQSAVRSGLLTGLSIVAVSGSAAVAGALLAQKFGRDAEREADHLGLLYMYNAGYEPHAMVTMFQELIERRQRSPGSVDQFFSSHPLTEERIDNVQAQISQLPPRTNLVERDAEFENVQRRLGC